MNTGVIVSDCLYLSLSLLSPTQCLHSTCVCVLEVSFCSAGGRLFCTFWLHITPLRYTPEVSSCFFCASSVWLCCVSGVSRLAVFCSYLSRWASSWLENIRCPLRSLPRCFRCQQGFGLVPLLPVSSCCSVSPHVGAVCSGRARGDGFSLTNIQDLHLDRPGQAWGGEQLSTSWSLVVRGPRLGGGPAQ